MFRDKVQGQSGAARAVDLKKKSLKWLHMEDQTDESELMPPDVQKIHTWSQRYLQIMGDHPMEQEGERAWTGSLRRHGSVAAVWTSCPEEPVAEVFLSGR